MEIDKSTIGEFGNFRIYESRGEKCRRKFIDSETGMLIVMMQQGTLEDGFTGESYYTMIDSENGEIIEVEDRKNYISYEEISGTDEELKISWKRRRIPWLKGDEYFEFDIFDESEKEPIKLKFWSAFSEKPHKTIPEWYKEQILAKEKEDEDVIGYQKKTYSEKLKFWSGNLHQQMRWNGESGYDEYAVFSKKWLESTKKIEPLIEQILDDVIEKYWRNYWDENKIKEALKK